jgi:uncharacterized NAD-dependent epimerase/dehydratase family protein
MAEDTNRSIRAPKDSLVVLDEQVQKVEALKDVEEEDYEIPEAREMAEEQRLSALDREGDRMEDQIDKNIDRAIEQGEKEKEA